VVAHTLRDFVSNHTGEGLAALKVDFKNAFNCVDRSSFLASIHSSLPGLYPWVEWCYSEPSVLFMQPLGGHFFFVRGSTGRPLGPPSF
jgi:hypothetical protein